MTAAVHDPADEPRVDRTGTTTRVSAVTRSSPTVWSRTTPGPLSEAELLFYDTHGYLLLPSFVDRRHAAILCDEAERLRAAREARAVATEEGSNAPRTITDVHLDHGPFEALMDHPGIVGAARQILADDVYALEAYVDYKVAFDGRGRAWRADYDAFRRQRVVQSMRVLTIRLFLTTSRACNGPLMVIPGSHRVSVPCVGTTSDVASRAPDREIVRALERTYGIDVITGGPGTVVLLDANLLYASSDNPSPRDRVVLGCAFNAKSNAPRPKR